MIQFDEHIFQRGWNHQLGPDFYMWVFPKIGVPQKDGL